MSNHVFELRSTFAGGLSGQGKIAGAGLERPFSAPSQLGGPGIGTNPEELIVAASASCTLLTLSAILDRRGIAARGLEMASEVTVTSPPNLSIVSITHRLRIDLPGADEATKRAALDAAARAEQVCMIARALQGNVAVRVEAEIV